MEEDIFSVDADLTALKELEETLKENPDKEWLEYDGRKWIKEDYVVLKSKVKEKIEEIDNEKLNYSESEYYLENEIKGYAIEYLRELLREE